MAATSAYAVETARESCEAAAVARPWPLTHAFACAAAKASAVTVTMASTVALAEAKLILFEARAKT